MYANMCAAVHCDNPTEFVIHCYHFVLYCLQTDTPNMFIFYSHPFGRHKQVASLYEE